MATAGNTVHKIQKFSYTDANNTTVYNSDVKVQGNLTVVGSSVYAQSQVLLVKDNIITLNAAIGQSDTPLFNAGIEVDRGNQPNVSFIWNESSQAWQFTSDGTTYESLGGGSSGVYANAAFIQANAAFNVANTGSSDTFARTQANASFIQANAAFNAANNASDSWVRNQANLAYTHANSSYAFANTTTAWGTRQAFVATAGQTIFSPGSGYLPGYIDVYYNGLKLYGAEDYTATDGINVTLTNPATVNSIIEIVGFGANVPAANVYVLNSMASIVQRQTFFANSGQTTFTVTGGYRIGYIDVYYNGLKINIPEDVTANNGSTIDFIGLTPTTNDIIEIVGLTPNVALANAIPITGGTISGGLTLAGNVNPVTDNTYYLGSATNRWHSLFVGPGSIDIGGLKLSNVGGTLSVESPGGVPSTFIDTFARGQANAAFTSANNVAPQVQPAFDKANAAFNAANSVNVYGANTSVTSYFAVPIGNTAQKPASPPLGAIRYDTSNSALETYIASGWLSIVSDTPIIDSVYPTTFNGNVGTSFTLTGINFKPDATVSFVTANGNFVSAASVVYSSQTQLIATTIRDFTVAEEPLGVRVSQRGGAGIGSLLGVIDCGSTPTWNSASGSLGTYYDSQRSSVTIQLGGYDAEDANANLIFSIATGGLPTGLSLNANGAITGTPSAVVANTTNNFSVVITDSGGNQSAERSFSLTVLAPITLATYTYTGSDQAFTVPSGITKFNAYLWGAGGGGGGGNAWSPGGAGGYTFGTVTTTPGTSYVMVVGKAGESRGGGAGAAGSTYGFAGNAGNNGFGGSGGGLTGIFTGSATVLYTDQSRAVLIAGGGGGGAYDQGNYGGNGGGSSGNAGNGGPAGGGGTQSAVGSSTGTVASFMRGGTANGGDEGGGGGGGGGYYGGGGGNGSSGGNGGGGSGYIGHASVSNGVTTTQTAGTFTPPQTGSSYYASTIGNSGTSSASAGAGRIVITI